MPTFKHKMPIDLYIEWARLATKDEDCSLLKMVKTVSYNMASSSKCSLSYILYFKIQKYTNCP